MRIALVSCVKSKRESQAPAKDLYAVSFLPEEPGQGLFSRLRLSRRRLPRRKLKAKSISRRISRRNSSPSPARRSS
jgi:hypothetical protein